MLERAALSSDVQYGSSPPVAAEGIGGAERSDVDAPGAHFVKCSGDWCPTVVPTNVVIAVARSAAVEPATQQAVRENFIN
jgi:hypothetical protein